MNPNSPPPLPELAFLKRLGLTYKVGLVVASIGVLVILVSGVFGAVFYELVSSVLELLEHQKAGNICLRTNPVPDRIYCDSSAGRQ